MPATPVTNTDRYYVDYEGPMGKRTMQFRAIPGSNQSQIVSSIVGFINTVVPIVYSSVQFNGLRFSAIGSNVTNPLSWAVIAGQAAGTLSATNYPLFVSWVGRSSNGKRIKLTLYGVNVGLTTDFRINSGESGTVLAAANYLNSASALFVAIDGIKPVWKSYGNQGLNAYHQRKRRTAV